MSALETDGFKVVTDWTHMGTWIYRSDGTDISSDVNELTIRLRVPEEPVVELVVYDRNGDGNKFVDQETGEVPTHRETGRLISLEPPSSAR